MERSEIIINKLKKDILNKKLKIQTLHYKMNNEYNDYIIEEVERDLLKDKLELNKLTETLKFELEKDKNEKLIYRKSLEKIKESINEFAKVSRTNSKLKKHTAEIAKIINVIDYYLITPIR